MRTTVFKRVSSALSGPHRRQNQRHHLSSLAAPGEPAADAAVVRGLRRAPSSTIRRHSSRLAGHAGDPALQQRLAAVKHANKRALARLVRDRLGLRLDPAALFDVQIKRIHEYKRQLLNILETIARYLTRSGRSRTATGSRGSRSSPARRPPSYMQAKLIIKLANDVAEMVNTDPVGRRSAEGGFYRQLQRQSRRGDHPGGRSVGADLDRRASRPRAPAT